MLATKACPVVGTRHGDMLTLFLNSQRCIKTRKLTQKPAAPVLSQHQNTLWILYEQNRTKTFRLKNEMKSELKLKLQWNFTHASKHKDKKERWRVRSAVLTRGQHRQTGRVGDLVSDRAGCSAVVAEDSVELLGDPDESRPATQLLQFASTDIGAGGADPSQDVSYRCIDRTFVRNFNRLPLWSSGSKKVKHTMILEASAP